MYTPPRESLTGSTAAAVTQLKSIGTRTTVSLPYPSPTMSLPLNAQLKAILEDRFTPEDLAEVLALVAQEKVPESQIITFLALLHAKGLDMNAAYLAAAANTLRHAARLPDASKLDPEGYVDIVGTGGDGQNTFNVSTSAAIVAAGMGIKVGKHGGKASTSMSGAGDLLTCLGADMSRVHQSTVPEIVAKGPFCFLFAPMFHPVMNRVAPVRKSMGIPTLFNVLGPLVNPIPVKARIIGVYSETLGPIFAEAITHINRVQGMSQSPALVVWGEEGLDEISPAGRTKVWKVTPSQEIEEFYLTPEDFGLRRHPLTEVSSGTPTENATVLKQLLSNELAEDHPIADYVVMNAAALAVIDGFAKDWKHGVELARESIKSGKALNALETFVEASQAAEKET